MTSRIVSFIAWLCLLAALCMTVVASPVPIDAANSTVTHTEEGRDLEKRVTRTGRATWFHAGLGNCGRRHTDSAPVVAMGKAFYDRNKGSNCGQWVEIINAKTRKKAYGQVWDSCPSCSDSQLDLSPSLFRQFATLEQGVFTAEWHFMAKGWNP
ncbi:expansin family protein [Coprinellus micaceus]|uniref:Expansin family protein n=1 Tax=Coprinellus micaceus TaxID=71717 RepID=A0A4Y7T9D8_COPMI|nr:expansin family protein [Coprinellus micaceus]